MLQPAYSTHLAAEVRRFFSLSPAELGRYLGVPAMQVAHVEAGRRGLTTRAESRLLTLAQLLPLPHGAGAPLELPVRPAEALPGDGEAATGPLTARLRRCDYLAARARFELENQQQRTAAAARRRAALVRLRADLLAATPAAPPDPAFDPAHAARWLARLTADTAAAPAPPTAAELTLLAVRLAALEFEADQLREALGG
ncbi:hypothetical protein [Hymenobacter rubripertinctus]|uniref:XRE family transcriptional regulator n=1 Tax=Hymenobacter rubripertinctus TaxID=2029981 RepID=A0A418QRP6_9BACT|nr:hypothetical protein [Hymenobacter rubripertinctus]RIY07824.1 hypothetical protein D0T11_15725 [Hymenobacter rubripertinctus]